MDVKRRLLESGVPLETIATKAGLDPARVAAIADGSDFSVRELIQIADALGLQVTDFAAEDEPRHEFEVLFRRSMSETDYSVLVDAVGQMSRRVASTFTLAPRLTSSVDWLVDFPPVRQTPDEAERAAEKFRAIHFDADLVSPMPGLPELLTERLGTVLFVVPDQKMDGASAIFRDAAFIFLAPRTFRPRMLFTLAHELGHLVAGHHAKEAVAFIDRAETTGALRIQTKKDEAFADAFASALLMPAGGVGRALSQIRKMSGTSGNLGDVEVLLLSRIYCVSFEVAARRCEALQLLPMGGARSLYEFLNKKFGSPEKRAEQLGLPDRADIEIPSLPSSLIETAISRIKSGELSVGKASTLLQLTVAELHERHRATVH